jgi:hypothetical protein
MRRFIHTFIFRLPYNHYAMKAFEELIEEVYQDGDLRPEFVKFVQLRRQRRETIRQWKEKMPIPDQALRFLNYYEISQTPTDLSPEMVSVQWGLTILSSSLFKTLSLRYPLAAEELHRLREAVVLRYEQAL